MRTVTISRKGWERYLAEARRFARGRSERHIARMAEKVLRQQLGLREPYVIRVLAGSEKRGER